MKDEWVSCGDPEERSLSWSAIWIWDKQIKTSNEQHPRPSEIPGRLGTFSKVFFTGALFAVLLHTHLHMASIMNEIIQSPNHHPISFTRHAKNGLTFNVFYSEHASPPRHIGAYGDIYILKNEPTVFWKEDRWRPWSWGYQINHPTNQAYCLNFDFQGPIWNYALDGIVEPSFSNIMQAISHFFHILSMKKSGTHGTKVNPIVIDWGKRNFSAFSSIYLLVFRQSFFLLHLVRKWLNSKIWFWQVFKQNCRNFNWIIAIKELTAWYLSRINL